MFWSKKKSKGGQSAGSGSSKESTDNKKTPQAQQKSDALRAQAMNAMRTARTELGEETIRKMAEAIARKENSPTERAKARIQQADPDRVASEFLSLLGKRD